MTVKSYLIPKRDRIQDTFYISFKMHAFNSFEKVWVIELKSFFFKP